MEKIRINERVFKYSNEFKFKFFKLTESLGVTIATHDLSVAMRVS